MASGCQLQLFETNGYIVMDRTGHMAKITIYDLKTTETPALLNTLAHEYKQILQSFVESPDEGRAGGKVFDAKEEGGTICEFRI